MNELDELRKQVQELEKAACVLLRVHDKAVKVASHKNLDKGHQAYHNGEKFWISAIPLIGYEEVE